MKRVLYILILVLEIALVIGAYVFNYFTRKKLGMMRFVNAVNMKWQKQYPLELLKMIVIVVILVGMGILLYKMVKMKKNLTLKIKLSVVWMITLSFGYMGYTLLLDVKRMTAYYFISLMLAIAAMLQIGKTMFGMKEI